MVTAIKGNDTSTFGGNVDVTGNVVTDAPAFSAYQSTSQTITTTTWTKCQFQTEEFDTNNCYDNTIYRFTPNVEGYYQINSAVTITGSTVGNTIFTLYKNGSAFKQGNQVQAELSTPVLSTLVYANGTTDYFEVYFLQASGGNEATLNTQAMTYFQGYLARAV